MNKRIKKTQQLQTNEAKDAMQGALNQLIAQNEDNELLAKAAKLFATYSEQQTINSNTINAAQETCRRECTEKQQRRSKNYREIKRKMKEKNKEEKESNMPVFNVSDSEDEEDKEDNDFPESLNAAHQILAELYYQAGLLSSP